MAGGMNPLVDGPKPKYNDPTKYVAPVEDDVQEYQYICKADGNRIRQNIYIPKRLYKNLMQHQIEGVQFLFNCMFGLSDANFPDLSGCILADTMGLGKTLQIITLIDILTKQNPYSTDRPYIKKCIIVAPVSLLGNWQREF
jgi:SNF2 family DNA or RNA helicase